MYKIEHNPNEHFKLLVSSSTSEETPFNRASTISFPVNSKDVYLTDTDDGFEVAVCMADDSVEKITVYSEDSLLNIREEGCNHLYIHVAIAAVVVLLDTNKGQQLLIVDSADSSDIELLQFLSNHCKVNSTELKTIDKDYHYVDDFIDTKFLTYEKDCDDKYSVTNTVGLNLFGETIPCVTDAATIILHPLKFGITTCEYLTQGSRELLLNIMKLGYKDDEVLLLLEHEDTFLILINKAGTLVYGRGGSLDSEALNAILMSTAKHYNLELKCSLPTAEEALYIANVMKHRDGVDTITEKHFVGNSHKHVVKFNSVSRHTRGVYLKRYNQRFTIANKMLTKCRVLYYRVLTMFA